MVDVVAKALCEAAGRTGCTPDQVKPACVMCKTLPDGRLECTMWTSFRFEAQQAIIAAYKWNKENRRWPSWCK